MLVASVTGSVTSFIGNHGVYAVFLLMAIDAVFPAASEVVLLYAGALASGAFPGQEVVLFGHTFPYGAGAFVVMALAATLGYLVGSIAGWEIGDHGGRPLLERHGRWFHLSQEKFARSEAWFGRWGRWAVFLGRLVPLVRSFISIPAGVFEYPFGPYVVLTLLGSAIWSFAVCGIGYAVGDSWGKAHDALRYVDYLILVTVILVAVYLIVRYVRNRHAEHPAR